MEDVRGETCLNFPASAQSGVQESRATRPEKMHRRQRNSALPKHFHYEQLQSQVDTIRLIKVEQSGLGNRLKCSLKHFSSSELALRPEGSRYIAVSYEWYLQHERVAATYKLKRILLNECTFLVNRNLYQFLKAWRSVFSRRGELNDWLWIDAISLDQNNDSEKGHQIPRMKTIFGHADEVVAWLGYESGTVEDALRAMENHFATHEFMNEEGELDILYELVSELSYWKRLWIIQELVLSKKARLLYRSTQVDFSAFGQGLEEYANRDKENDEEWHKFIDTLKRVRPTPGMANEAEVSHEEWVPSKYDMERWVAVGMAVHIDFIHECWLDREKPTEMLSFTELLTVFEHCECERWQDRIYALLGLVPGGENFVVNYTESRESLRERVIQSFGGPEMPFEQRMSWAAMSNRALRNILDRIIPISTNDGTDGVVGPGSSDLYEPRVPDDEAEAGSDVVSGSS